MEQSQQLQPWEGKVDAKLANTTAHQAWTLLLHDFCNFHRLLPAVDDCRLVDGAEGRPGCVRYLTSASVPTADGSAVAWAKERLLAVDGEGLSYTYEVADNNIGFGRYVTQMKAVPEGSDDNGGSAGEGCRLVWSFLGDPLEGWTQEGLVSFLGTSLQVIARSIEGACRAAKAQEE